MMLALIWILACSQPVDTGAVDTEPDTDSACPWDDDSAQAPTEVQGEVQGYLCPRGDQDWYRVQLGGQEELLQVSLSLGDAPISPVQLTWAVWEATGAEVVGQPGAEEQAEAGAPLSLVHGLEPGTWLVQVRDVGGDDEDTRHPYTLSVQGLEDPDDNEPNDQQSQATPLGSAPTSGQISFRGDVDWFVVSVEDRSLVSVGLTAPTGDMEPAIEVLDAEGEVVVRTSNPAGGSQPTELEWTTGAEVGGDWHVVVSDDDGDASDLDQVYTLLVSTRPDPDDNEPNDHPDQATPLGSAACGPGSSTLAPVGGYLATTGDVDWFEVDLSSCEAGVLEARVTSAGELPEGLDPELRLVREVPGEGCAMDQDCAELSLTCSEDMQCSLYGNTCLGSHHCAGAGVCLPSGLCAAKLVGEVDEDGDGAATLTAPLRSWDKLWLAVGDHRGDARSADHAYSLAVSVIDDPDPHEPSDHYTGGPPAGSQASWHAGYASELPVRDCDGDLLPEDQDCCDGPEDFTTGWLSWAYDQDWYRYPHPCPGEDCMVRVHLQGDAGPVELYTRVFTGTSAWYDNLFDAVDLGDSAAVSAVFGGLEEEDECYYAWQGHEGEPFWYYVSVRDTVYRSASEPTGGTWDASTDQSYGLCVEKVASGCAEPPCHLYTDGCGPP